MPLSTFFLLNRVGFLAFFIQAWWSAGKYIKDIISLPRRPAVASWIDLVPNVKITNDNNDDDDDDDLSPRAAATDKEPTLLLLPEHAGAKHWVGEGVRVVYWPRLFFQSKQTWVGEGGKQDWVGAAAKNLKSIEDGARLNTLSISAILKNMMKWENGKYEKGGG